MQIALNPAVKNQVVFGYSPSASTPPLLGIYKNSSVSPTGATQIVTPTYTFIASIQVSLDGSFVYYIAAIGSGDTFLYKVPITGGTPVQLDTDQVFTANVDVVNGSMITYDKLVSYSNGNILSAVFVRSTASSATPIQLTNDSNSNYACPQFSKDGTKIALESDKADSNFEVYVMSATDGSNLTQITNDPTIAKQYTGVAYSADGTAVAYIGETAGVYKSPPIGNTGSSAQLVNDATVNDGLYWTSTTGRARGGTTAYLGHRRKHGLIP